MARYRGRDWPDEPEDEPDTGSLNRGLARQKKKTWETRDENGQVTRWYDGFPDPAVVRQDPAATLTKVEHLTQWSSQPRCARRPYVGLDGQDIALGPRNTNVLVLAPSQGGGKTSGVIVPSVLLQDGPCVVTSSKPDALVATAMARSLSGQVWHFPVDGAAPVSGTKHLRWTVLDGCDSWDVANRVAYQLAELSDAQDGVTSKSGEASFFIDQARQVIAPMLQWATRFGLAAEDIYELVSNPRPGGPGSKTVGLLDVVDQLRSVGCTKAANALDGQCRAPERQRASVFSTAAKALRVFSLDATSRATRKPNFDIREFIKSKDTVYLTAANQELAGVLVVMFLTRVIEVANELFTEEESKEALGEEFLERPAVALMLDELATAARISTLPQMLARGNRGYYIVGVLQDLSQARALWGNDLGRGMLTLFQNVLIFRGLRDAGLLEDISKFAGEMWIRTHSGGSNSSSSGLMNYTQGSNDGWQEQRVPRLPIDLVAQGNPQHSDIILWLRPDGTFQWLYNAPYYRAYPWVKALVNAVSTIAQLPTADRRRLLPAPKMFAEQPVADEHWGWNQQFVGARDTLRSTRNETRRALQNLED